MNQTQRKYALDRVDQITAIKIQEINNTWILDPKNKAVQIPLYIFATDGEVIKTLLGVTGKFEIKSDKELLELARLHEKQTGTLKLQNLIQPINPSEIKKAQEHNTKIQIRYSNEVTVNVIKLRTKADEVKDAIMLSGEEDALKAIAAFTNFKV